MFWEVAETTSGFAACVQVASLKLEHERSWVDRVIHVDVAEVGHSYNVQTGLAACRESALLSN